MRILRGLSVAGALMAANVAGAQTTISTPGGSSIFSWGHPDTKTYGQTFTAGADNVLQSFAFWMGAVPNTDFKGYVFAWDDANNMATGTALFESAVVSGHGGGQVTMSTGGTTLATGSMYVAFLSVMGLPNSGETNAWESSGFDADGDGMFVFQNSFAGNWTTDAWSECWQGCGSDLRYEMVFNDAVAVPEPGSMVLFGTGLLGLAGVVRNRRKSA